MPGEDGYDLIRQVRRLEAVRGRHIQPSRSPLTRRPRTGAARSTRATTATAKAGRSLAVAPLIARLLLPRERGL
jgi:hypothetical protein